MDTTTKVTIPFRLNKFTCSCGNVKVLNLTKCATCYMVRINRIIKEGK